MSQLLKYTETLPLARSTIQAAIAQFTADAKAARVKQFSFLHVSDDTTAKIVADAVGDGWRLAKLIRRRRLYYELHRIPFTGMKVQS